MRKILLLFITTWCVCFTALAQRTISGKVTSVEDGSALPGVSIIIKGTTVGTVTDAAGTYKLAVPDDASTVSFTFIGFKAQEIQIGTRSVIDIAMENDVTQLSEIVVTGYSETSQRNLVSAVGQVNSQALQNVVLTDVSQMLQGRTAGVMSSSGSGQPGSVQSIRIRGTSTLTAGASPLYVIDGIPVTSGDLTQGGGSAANASNSPAGSNDVLANINPNDIESVTILKDAAATSLYGSRGGNGVVLITTKRGRAGESTITARVQYGVTIKNQGNFKMMNGQQVYDYERKILSMSGLTQEDVNAEYPAALLDSTYNWIDAAFQQGRTANYEVQAQGGDNKTKFFVSGGVYDQQGVLIASDFKRYSMRANLDHRLNDKMDISLNMNVSYTNQHNAFPGNQFGSPILSAYTTTPLQNPINPNTGKMFTGDEYNYKGFTNNNLLYSAARNYAKNNVLRSLGKVAFGYEIIKSLKFTETVGVDMIGTREINYYDATTHDGVANNGDLFNGYSQDLTLTSQSKLSGDWSFGKSNLNALAIVEVQKNKSEGFFAGGKGFASPLLQTLNSAALPNYVGGLTTGYSFLSYIGQANYNYADKYFVTASFRRDGSSRFGIDNRFANFYSIGTSWRIIDEEFIKGISTLSDLKLRASYGTAGNAAILVDDVVDNFPSLELYGFGSAYNGKPGSAPSQISNPRLTWEQTATANIGIDAAIFNDRIRATVDVYNRISTDLLLSMPVSSTSGFSSALRNIGKVRNRGIEGTIGTVNTQGAVRWTTDFNITINRSEIMELPDHADIINPSNTLQIFREGQPLNAHYLRQWAGVNPADGSPLWSTADGGVTGTYANAARFIVGQPQPLFMGGLNNSISYKGITLSLFFYYSMGNQIYNQTRQYIESDGARIGWNHMIEAGQDYWEKPGDIAKRPKPVPGGNLSSNSPSSRYIENGSYIRLRNVMLAYSLPTTLIGKAGFKGARIYGQGQNLWTWTHYSGFDPEMDASGSEFFRYPVGKSVTFGVELTF